MLDRPKFPIWPLVVGTYNGLYTHLTALIRIALVPAVLVLAMYALYTSVYGSPIFAADETVDIPPAYLILQLVEQFLVVAFTVRWIRYLLAADRDPQPPFGLQISARTWLCFAYLLFLQLCLLFLSIVVVPLFGGAANPVIQFLVTIGMIVAAMQLFRFALIIPSVALDDPQSIGWLWRKTSGAWLRLAGGLLMAGLPAALLFLMLSLAGKPDGPAALGLRIVNVVSIEFLSAALTSGYLALAFRWFRTQ